jgi:hypothetical protein
MVEHEKAREMKVRDIPPFGIRMPPDLKERLSNEAKINGRSLNVEIVLRLKRSFENMAIDEHPRYTMEHPVSGGYTSDITDIERKLLTIFRRMPVEKQLALLSLFN